jgi:hypothetical protein
VALTSTALTTKVAPAVDSTIGSATTALPATTTDASGMAETALIAETSLWAIALKLALAPENSAQAAIKIVVTVFFMDVWRMPGLGSCS